MPKISIYVPDEMKARMDETDDRANWSAIAQRAFGVELNHIEAVKEIETMNDVIERLRESKQSSDESDQNVGRRQGQIWAKKYAAYDELRRLDGLDLSAYAGDVHAILEEIRTECGVDEFFNIDSNSDLTEAYTSAFFEGAIEVWNEIEDKI